MTKPKKRGRPKIKPKDSAIPCQFRLYAKHIYLLTEIAKALKTQKTDVIRLLVEEEANKLGITYKGGE